MADSPEERADNRPEQPSASSPDTVPDDKTSAGGVFNKALRTLLDPEACRKVVARIAHGKGDLADGSFRSAPGSLAAPKIAIGNYRTASFCGSSWQNMVGEGRVKFCEKCKLQVYDFGGLELAEVDKLVLQRENKKAEQFFKRSDGKFLTGDCPVGARRKLNTLVLGAGAAAIVLFFAGLCFVSITSGGSAPQPVLNQIHPVPVVPSKSSEIRPLACQKNWKYPSPISVEKNSAMQGTVNYTPEAKIKGWKYPAPMSAAAGQMSQLTAADQKRMGMPAYEFKFWKYKSPMSRN